MIKPVYVFSGFLDAGKTSVIKETLSDEQFTMGERTLIVSFEQGDVEYDEDFLNKAHAQVVYLDRLEDFSKEQMAEYELDYDFDRIFVELNGLETDEKLLSQGFIRNWDLAEILAIFDASQFMNQLTNMKTFVFDHVRYADVCIFNRADTIDKRFVRNNLKAANPRIQIIYENSDGSVSNGMEDSFFDLNADPLVIDDNDYGLWYMDALDHPEKYEGHRLTLNMTLVEALPENKAVIMGRKAMVCCANDITDIGITVVNLHAEDINKGVFYEVTGTIHCVDDTEGYKTCLLYMESFKEGKTPTEELVSFN